jgi:hypothetical protein
LKESRPAAHKLFAALLPSDKNEAIEDKEKAGMILTDTQRILELGSLLHAPTAAPTSFDTNLEAQIGVQREKIVRLKKSCVSHAVSNGWLPVLCTLSEAKLMDRGHAMQQRHKMLFADPTIHIDKVRAASVHRQEELMAKKILWLVNHQRELVADIQSEAFLTTTLNESLAHGVKLSSVAPYDTLREFKAEISQRIATQTSAPTAAPTDNTQDEFDRIRELQAALQVSVLKQAKSLSADVPGAQTTVQKVIQCILKADESKSIEEIRSLCDSKQFEAADFVIPELGGKTMKQARVLAKSYKQAIIVAMLGHGKTKTLKLRGLLRALLQSMGVVADDCQGELKKSTCDVGASSKTACLKCLKARKESKCTEEKRWAFCGMEDPTIDCRGELKRSTCDIDKLQHSATECYACVLAHKMKINKQLVPESKCTDNNLAGFCGDRSESREVLSNGCREELQQSTCSTGEASSLSACRRCVQIHKMQMDNDVLAQSKCTNEKHKLSSFCELREDVKITSCKQTLDGTLCDSAADCMGCIRGHNQLVARSKCTQRHIHVFCDVVDGAGEREAAMGSSSNDMGDVDDFKVH